MNYSLKPKITTPTNNMGKIEEFCSYLFSVRTVFHLLHLKTQSYAEHKALNDLYEGVLEIADTLIESAQIDSLLNLIVPESKITSNPLDYTKEVLDYVRANRNVFPYSFQQNELDTLELLLSSGIYKLRFLK